MVWLSIVGASASPPAFEQAIEEGDYGRIVAVVVDRAGEIVYERRFRAGVHRRGAPRDLDPALHDIRSAGKSITALAVGIAVDDGSLSLEQQVLPDVSVQDLLTMRSTLACDDGRRRSPGNEERMYRRRRWRTFVEALPRRTERSFSYCTAGVFYLGQIVQDAVGQPFDAYVEHRLFAPLGIDAVRWRSSPSREVQAGGQLELRAADLTRLGRLVLNGGSWEGRQVVSKDWLERMLTAYTSQGPVGYGFLWWRRPIRTAQGWVGSWSMQGNGGNLVALVPTHDAVVTVQSANYNRSWAHDRSFEIVAHVLDSLGPPQRGSPRDGVGP